MRSFSILVTSVALVACTTTAAEQPTRSPAKQAEFAKLVEGKVAGPPQSCLPSYNQNDMVVIDDSTIAFRLSSSRIYVNHMQGPCTSLSGSNALVTKTYGTAQLCRGDIGQVVDLTNHFTVGSCVFGDFIPYTKPRT